MKPLSSLKVEDLSADNVAKCKAFNRAGDMIYNFDVRDSNRNCNAVCDEKTLRGWWPWPRNGA